MINIFLGRVGSDPCSGMRATMERKGATLCTTQDKRQKLSQTQRPRRACRMHSSSRHSYKGECSRGTFQKLVSQFTSNATAQLAMTKEAIVMFGLPEKERYTLEDLMQLAERIKTAYRIHIFKWVRFLPFPYVEISPISVWWQAKGCLYVCPRRRRLSQRLHSGPQ